MSHIIPAQTVGYLVPRLITRSVDPGLTLARVRFRTNQTDSAQTKNRVLQIFAYLGHSLLFRKRWSSITSEYDWCIYIIIHESHHHCPNQTKTRPETKQETNP